MSSQRPDGIYQALYIVTLIAGGSSGSPYKLPLADGTTGQALTTDGSGSVSFSSVGDVTGPVSSTDKNLVRWNGTTGKIVQNSTASLSDTGQLNISSLIASGVTYPTTILSGALWYTNSTNQVFQGCRLFAQNLTARTFGPGPGDHIRYNTVLHQAGTKITLDTSSAYTTALNVPSIGRITLNPGRYHIKAILQEMTDGAVTGYELVWTLYNSDAGTALTILVGASGGPRVLLHDETVVNIAVTTRIEFRATVNTVLVVGGYTNSFIEIEELPT
jgi:hypothetical protein